MQQVSAWLKNGSYEQGVALYLSLGTNSFLKKRFAACVDDFNKTKLREELERILGESGDEGAGSGTNITAPATGHPAPTPTTSLSAPKASSQENAIRYAQLNKRKTKLYSELNVLINERHHLPEGEDLRLCAVRILTINRQIGETFALIDYYQEHQCFPDEAPPKPILDPKKQMQLLRQTISKAKTRLDSGACRNMLQTTQLKAEAEKKLAVLVAAKKEKK